MNKMRSGTSIIKWALLASVLACLVLPGALLPTAGGQGATGREPAVKTPSRKALPPPTIKRPPASPRRVPPPPRTGTPARPTPRRAPEIELVLVPGGTFLMGSPESENGRARDEGPQHRVTVPSFRMGKFEVTQAQWRAVMGTNPSDFKGDDRPVENVSWNDAVEFCRRLSQMTGKQYRLPSEAEWEYAARAKTQTPFAFGSSLSSEQANFRGNSAREQTTPVGSFQPNAFGLYDMHGNVWEWCADVWHVDYNGAPTDGSAWSSGGNSNPFFRVLRGGSYINYSWDLRSAERYSLPPTHRDHFYGFRVVMASQS